MLLLMLLAVTLLAPPQAEAERPATAREAAPIRRELLIHLRAEAADPSSAVGRGTRFVIYPVCVSTVDPRYASVWAWPLFQRHEVAEPGLLFVGRAGGEWRPIGSFQLAEGIGKRPFGLPREAHRDLMNGGRCIADQDIVERLLRGGELTIYRV